MLFCHIGWMKHYQGQNEDDLITNGGSFVKLNEAGHEICNFTNVSGTFYGYVQVGKERNGSYREGKINFKRLGIPTEKEVIEGCTVIWTATNQIEHDRKIVGWYKNASIFQRYQPFKKIPPLQRRNNITGYWISAPADSCVLLPEDQRTFSVPRMEKGFPGISPIWYADSKESARFVDQTRAFISDLQDSNSVLDDLGSDYIGNIEPTRVVGTHYRFKRDPRVRGAVLHRANGCCEYCGERGFLLPGGGHYLEAHHIISLAEVGPDTLDNVIALCPRHHREAHFGADRLHLERSFAEKLEILIQQNSTK